MMIRNDLLTCTEMGAGLCVGLVGSGYQWAQAELQKRADRADQSVLFFLAGANFWEKHAKNCAIMSMAHITYAIAH